MMVTQLELELQDAAATATTTTTTTADATPDNYESALGKAIAYWRSGKLIPLTLATELLSEGYDVGTLEAQHLAKHSIC